MKFDYRWRWDTIWLNIRGKFYDIYYGIANIFKWLPIIWGDRDYDHSFLLSILEFKFKNMAILFTKYGIAQCSEEQAITCLTLSKLCRRLKDEPYWEEAETGKVEYLDGFGNFNQMDFKKFDRLQKADLKLLAKTLEKKLLGLWD